jgi:hypothetical protein
MAAVQRLHYCLVFSKNKVMTNETGCEVAHEYYINLPSDMHVTSYIYIYRYFKFVFVNMQLCMPRGKGARDGFGILRIYQNELWT